VAFVAERGRLVRVEQPAQVHEPVASERGGSVTRRLFDHRNIASRPIPVAGPSWALGCHAMARARTTAEATETAVELRNLGQLVRARRRALGYTLSEVAERTGLSTPFLSQVENGVGTPSLTSLFSLARVLETTAEALLAGPPLEPIVVVRAQEGARYPVTDQVSGAQRRQLTSSAEPLSAAEYIVEPGTDLGGFEASSGRDLLHVLEGRLRVEIRRGDGIVADELAAGDTILYDTADAHRWLVAGAERTRFLHIVARAR